jgi:hypothetical protein
LKQWNNLTESERIFRWGEFRDSLKPLSANDRLIKLAQFFQSVPIASRQIDYYTPDSWPDPWELLHYGQSCPSSISLLMAYTLKLIGEENFKLLLVDDGTDLYLVPLVNDTHILNYILGEVSLIKTIEKELTVKSTYNVTDLKDIY